VLPYRVTVKYTVFVVRVPPDLRQLGIARARPGPVVEPTFHVQYTRPVDGAVFVVSPAAVDLVPE
jgi:hypothetical protein